MFALELEYTAAQYGTPGTNGKIITDLNLAPAPYVVGNLRTLIGAFYFF